MRIAVVSESPIEAINGVARSVRQVVAHLERRGHTVLVVCPRPGRTSAPDHLGRVEVVELPAVPLPWCRDFSLGVPTPAIAATLDAFRPDVVHLASPALVGARAAAVARARALPTVAIYQTDLVGFAAQYGHPRAARLLWAWLRRLHADVDRTLAPSRAAAATLEQHGVPRVHRWGRGVDPVAFSPAHRTRPPTAEVATVRIGYVGRLATEKRVDRLEYLADLPGAELVVVGDGPSRRHLERRLPSAHFTGALAGAELSRAYADLDVFVHTGTHETFCQAVQEAMASGVAVVAPAVGGPLDLVSPGRTGYLWDPAHETSLRAAVATIAADGPTRADLGRRGRTDVAERTWERIGDELIGHYEAALGGRTRLTVAA